MNRYPHAMLRHYGANPPKPQLDFNPYQYQPFLEIFEKNNEEKWNWNGKNLFIKDEVGVGKTIEAGIILYQLLKENDNLSVLIVSPVKLRSNWCNELRKFFGLEIETDGRYHQFMHLSYSDFIDRGKSAKSNKSEYELSLEEEEAEKEEAVDFTDKAFIPECIDNDITKGNKKFDIIIVDEAHRLRNKSSCYHKGIERILAENHTGNGPVIFLSGTPVVNGSNDYKTVKELIHPDDSKDDLAETASSQAEAYAMTVSPEKEMIPVTPEEGVEGEIFRIADEIGGCAPRLAASSPSAFLNMLRKKAKDESLSADEIDEDEGIETFKKSPGEYISDIEKIREIKDFTPAKQEELLKLINREENKKKSYIIFSCYVATCEEIKRFLENNNVSADCLTGSSKKNEINNAIQRFKDGTVRVLVCSDALSEGHNLQFCSNIIHYDLPFVPARVSQRNGRIYRHGQKEKPHFTFLFVEGTYDEYLYCNIFLSKMKQADALAQAGKIVPMIGLPNIDELMAKLTEKKFQTPEQAELTSMMNYIVNDKSKVKQYALIIEKSKLWKDLSQKITEKKNVQKELKSYAALIDKYLEMKQDEFAEKNRKQYVRTAMNVGNDLGIRDIQNLPQPISSTNPEEFENFQKSLKAAIEQSIASNKWHRVTGGQYDI